MEKRIGVVGVVVENRAAAAKRINEILSDHGEIIVGRMGVPYRDRNVSVIALIVDGTTDEIGALTGKLGAVQGVTVKTALAARKAAPGRGAGDRGGGAEQRACPGQREAVPDGGEDCRIRG